jgi:hypothetical protein
LAYVGIYPAHLPDTEPEIDVNPKQNS